jgi:hypothetical protein
LSRFIRALIASTEIPSAAAHSALVTNSTDPHLRQFPCRENGAASQRTRTKARPASDASIMLTADAYA